MLPRAATASAVATIGSGLNSVQVKQRLAFLKSLVLGQDATSSLRSRAVHSGAWIGVGFGIQKVLQLGSNLILTRLLFPEAFGLMALATVFLVGLQMFSDIGLKPAVIRDPRGDDPQFLNTAWTIQVARGLLLCAIGVAIAYPISLIYRQPIMFPLLSVLSTTAAINGFMSIGMATAERRLDFRTITIVQIAGQVVSIGLLVTLAYFWRSVWALAVANVVSTAMTVAIGYLILPRHTHQLAMDRDAAKSLIHFGRWILFSTLATYLGGEGLKAIQGGLLSPAEFGVLAIAYTIAGIPNELAARLSSSLGLPVLAETYRNAPDAARSVLSALRKRTITISLILFTGVIAISEPAIELLYDPRYHNAAEYIAALCLSSAVTTIGLGYISSILAIGQSSLYFHIMSTTFVVRSIGLFLGFEFDGILGMLYGVALSNVLIFFFTCIFAKKLNISNTLIDTASLAYTLCLTLAYIYVT
jgi:O-antigen/teichoic acid export membrane protein